MTSNRSTNNIISTYKPELIKLKKLIPLDSSDKLLIESVVDGLPNNITYNCCQLSTLIKIIDRYCREDTLLADKLHEFIQRTIGPVIKLFAVEQDTNLSLAIEFPTPLIKQIFLRQMCIKDMPLDVMQYDNGMEALFEKSKHIVCLSAIKTATQQLAVVFPYAKLKNRFVQLINLNNTDLIAAHQTETQLIINDRRILDTASKFHLSIVCPYFLEYCEIQRYAHTVAQGRRDHFSFFSSEILPEEIAINITLAAASAKVMDINEQIEIVKSVISKTKNQSHHSTNQSHHSTCSDNNDKSYYHLF